MQTVIIRFDYPDHGDPIRFTRVDGEKCSCSWWEGMDDWDKDCHRTDRYREIPLYHWELIEKRQDEIDKAWRRDIRISEHWFKRIFRK